MFNFFKKKFLLLKDMDLYVDIHSHLIPNIDDGAKTIEESLSLLTTLEELGYKKCITTPHIMIDTYHNTKISILKNFEYLKFAMSDKKLEIEIEVAAEYYLDEGLLPLIKNNDLLLIGNKYVLFETSYLHRPQQLEEVIFEILTAGYIPLLAHPERYRYMNCDIEAFKMLKSLGVEFQVNLNSFNGYYGKNAKQQAKLLSKHGLIDFLGSDTHHDNHLKNLKILFNEKIYADIFKFNSIKNNLL